jgi:hypothetical protein
MTRELHKISSLVFFSVLSIFLFSEESRAVAPEATITPKGAVDLYEYTTLCSGTNLGNTLNTKRGIIVPQDSAGLVNYLYLHGNDRPRIGQICEGAYRLCEIADEIKEPIIIPETKVTGSDPQQLVTNAQMKCLLDEAREVLLGNGVELPNNYSIAAHSAGAYLASKIFVANLGATYPIQDTLIFDGCYGGTGRGNWCRQIVDRVSGANRIHVYYQKAAEGTEADSKAVKSYASAKVELYEVDMDHQGVPYYCFADHRSGDRCKGKVLAVNNVPVNAPTPSTTGGSTPTAGDASQTTSTPTQLKKFATDLNKLQAKSLPELVGTIIKGLMGIVGSITLVMIIYGGVLWMTARGNSEQTGKAQRTVVWAALGIVLIFASYALVSFMFELF